VAITPQDSATGHGLGSALQALIGLASGLVGSLLGFGGSVVGLAGRLLDATGALLRDAATQEPPDAPALRALAGGAALRSRRGESEGARGDRAREPVSRPAPPLDPDLSLPESHDEDRVLVLPRDPWTVYVCWDLAPATRQRRDDALVADPTGPREALQVEAEDDPAVPGGDAAASAWIVPLAPHAASAYVDLLRPRRAVRVAVGLHATGGPFVALAASASVRVPAGGPAGDEAPTWKSLAHGDAAAAEPPALPSREAREVLFQRAGESELATSGTRPPGHHVLETESLTGSKPRTA